MEGAGASQGKGSSFSIWLPGDSGTLLEDEGKVDHPDNSLPPELPVSSGPLPVVLLVEDNKVNKELTMLFLRNICDVEYAHDAATAIGMVRSKKYDAILMDIHLGYGMNGIDATRVTQSGPQKRAVTGNHLEEIPEEPTRAILGFGVCIECAVEVGVLQWCW